MAPQGTYRPPSGRCGSAHTRPHTPHQGQAPSVPCQCFFQPSSGPSQHLCLITWRAWDSKWLADFNVAHEANRTGTRRWLRQILRSRVQSTNEELKQRHKANTVVGCCSTAPLGRAAFRGQDSKVGTAAMDLVPKTRGRSFGPDAKRFSVCLPLRIARPSDKPGH